MVNPEQQPEQQPQGQPQSFEDLVEPHELAAHLKLISRASGGFRFRPDPSLPEGQTGYTRKDTGEIFYNPKMLAGNEELGIKPWEREDVLGFTYHEAGHHNPEVLEFDDALVEKIGDPDIVPEAYRGTPESETRFHNAIYRHLCNGLIDVWLESYMGRRPYAPIREAITNFQSAKGEWDDYKSISKPEQLMQVLLRSRYLEQENLEQKVDPEVFESYQKIQESGAMKTLMNTKDHENYFANKLQLERAMQRKVNAYENQFLPEYLKLLESELEERKQQQQQAGEGEPGEGEPGEGQPGSAPSEAVPLTAEEEQQIAQQLLEELEKAGQEFSSAAPAQDEEAKRQQKMQQIQAQAEAAAKGEELPQAEPGEPQAPPAGAEQLARRAEELRRQEMQRAQQGLAESLGVKQESVKKWEDIRKNYREQIDSTASALAEVFLDDRRKKLEFMHREGEVVPGLEYETVAAIISGDVDPDTRMKTVENPDFLETEIEFIVDTSGSMSGPKLDRSVEMMVVITEAMNRVRETLDSENLLANNEEQPFRAGVTTFSDKAERVTRLDEPLTDQKELTIIDQASKVGGGTEETAALKEVYQQLTLEKTNVIKLMIVLTDGEGNQAGVAPIIQQVENDDEVVFLALGLGDNEETAQGIVNTYLQPLQNRKQNVFGEAAADPDQALPTVIEFVKREVTKRRRF